LGKCSVASSAVVVHYIPSCTEEDHGQTPVASPSRRMQISYLHQSQGRFAEGLPLKNLENSKEDSFDRSCHVLEAVQKPSERGIPCRSATLSIEANDVKNVLRHLSRAVLAPVRTRDLCFFYAQVTHRSIVQDTKYRCLGSCLIVDHDNRDYPIDGLHDRQEQGSLRGSAQDRRANNACRCAHSVSGECILTETASQQVSGQQPWGGSMPKASWQIQTWAWGP
jgi:hypothetical protein